MSFVKLMKTKNLAGRYIYLPLMSMVLLHMPFVFAATTPHHSASVIHAHPEMDTVKACNQERAEPSPDAATVAYENMQLGHMGLSRAAYDHAMKGFNYLVRVGKIAKENIISIADFSKPSSQKRLFVIDINKQKVLFNTYVAHGINSGREYANQFSNIPESNKSSLGFYETRNTYVGANGYSLKLAGLERGINDNAEKRDIVIHGAEYVDESLIRSQGYIGRSWGCPALPEKLHKPIIDRIKNGTCLFIYGASNAYLKKSRIINA